MSNKLKTFKPKKIKFKKNEQPTVAMPDMYTLNKQMMAKEPLLTPEQFEDIKIVWLSISKYIYNVHYLFISLTLNNSIIILITHTPIVTPIIPFFTLLLFSLLTIIFCSL